MTLRALLELSPLLAQGVVAATLLAVVMLGVLAAVRRSPRPATALGRSELAWLGLIVVAAAFTRLVGARDWLTVPFSFSELTPLYVADMIDRGTLWPEVLRRFTQYQAGSIDKSATVLPVAATAQLLLGPSLHLPVLIGALYGVASVLLAWLLGRSLRGPAFGLVFAAFLAASPLQLVWSRLGGIHGTSVTHVLLMLWCAHVAGRRRSLVLAIVAAVVVWGTLYQYYAARVAIPVAFAFLVAGLRAGRASWLRTVAVLAVTLATLCTIYAAAHPPGLKETLWPSFTGYVGNRGEQTLGEAVRRSAEAALAEAPTTFRRYFRAERAGGEPPTPAILWGMQFGGLCLAPIVLLGLVGMLRAVVRCRTEWPWLLFAAAGLTVPLLSVTTARRFVVFDAAWCGFAASGLLAILHSPLCRGLSARALVGVAALVSTLVTAWSFATVVVLHGVIPPAHFQPIPFGESGLGDGLTCRRCMEAAREIRDEVAHDRFVVLFDTDLKRENPTIPGGLPLYGRLAAVEAGRPSRFLEFYPVLANRTVPPLERGTYYDHVTTEFASYTIRRIEEARPAEIVWHFERPTQWEEWLAERLVAAGGVATRFATPLSTLPGLRVRTPWAERERAYDVLRALAAAMEPEREGCLRLEPIARVDRPFPVFHMTGPDEPASADPPHWTVGSWASVALDDFAADGPMPVGLSVDAVEHRIHVLDELGTYTVHDLASKSATAQPLVLTGVGLGCAVRAASAWWAVDPTIGALRTTDPDARSLPAGRWIGIANDGRDRIVLASADQELVVFDVAGRRELRRFPATVSPSRRVGVNECALVAAGRDWYATASSQTASLAVYDREGRPLGRLDPTTLYRGYVPVYAIAASGVHLAIAQGGRITTARIAAVPGCVASSTGGAHDRAPPGGSAPSAP
jgi:hypothetical protein